MVCKQTVVMGIAMKLGAYLVAEGLKPGEFGQRVGATAMAVRYWVRGDRTPRRDMMDKIRDASEGRVQPQDFFSSEEDAA